MATPAGSAFLRKEGRLLALSPPHGDGDDRSRADGEPARSHGARHGGDGRLGRETRLPVERCGGYLAWPSRAPSPLWRAAQGPGRFRFAPRARHRYARLCALALALHAGFAARAGRRGRLRELGRQGYCQRGSIAMSYRCSACGGPQPVGPFAGTSPRFGIVVCRCCGVHVESIGTYGLRGFCRPCWLSRRSFLARSGALRPATS